LKLTNEELKNRKALDDAKDICCQIGEKKEFAFMSKSHLALIIGKLYTLLSEKEEKIETLKKQVDDSALLIKQLKESTDEKK